MNELQVKTIVMEPAKIDFNFDELSSILHQQLVKYEGLEFTEKDVAACKKTITELNKGKKALNDYRLKTKKELSKEITDFEAKCKNLSNKFDDVIKPLKEQADEFEESRRAEKREKVQAMIVELIDKEGLDEKHAAQLVVEDSYLNKSTTLKTIREDLTTKAEHLGIQQDKLEGDIEIITGHVELINTKENINLPAEPFIGLLDFKTVTEVKMQIEAAAKAEVSKQEAEPVVEQEPVKPNDETFIETYEVIGTEAQLDALEEFMNQEKIKWNAL